MYYEKTLDRKTVASGKIISFEQLSVELHDGGKSVRDIVRHPGGCAIVPIDDDGNVYLVSQYRIAFERMTLELPAGKLEIGEPPQECASRELSEEIGMRARVLTHVMNIMSSPGFCDEVIHVFMASGLEPCDATPDPGEFLNVVKIPLDKLIDMIMAGEITDGKTVAGILFADRERRK